MQDSNSPATERPSTSTCPTTGTSILPPTQRREPQVLAEAGTQEARASTARRSRHQRENSRNYTSRVSIRKPRSTSTDRRRGNMPTAIRRSRLTLHIIYIIRDVTTRSLSRSTTPSSPTAAGTQVRASTATCGFRRCQPCISRRTA